MTDRIGFIENDELSAENIYKYLKRMGYDATRVDHDRELDVIAREIAESTFHAVVYDEELTVDRLFDGIVVFERVHVLNRSVPGIIYSSHGHAPLVTRAARAGMSAYVLKRADDGAELEVAIRKCLNGERYASTRIAAIFSQHDHGLTDRESQIVSVLGQGFTASKTIGEIIGTSHKTIDNQIREIAKKIKRTDDRGRIGKWAQDHGFNPPAYLEPDQLDRLTKELDDEGR